MFKIKRTEMVIQEFRFLDIKRTLFFYSKHSAFYFTKRSLCIESLLFNSSIYMVKQH